MAFDLEFMTKKDATQVTIRISTGLKCTEPVVNLGTERHTQISAELLRNHLRDTLANSLAAIRSHAYNQGWKDQASKSERKKTVFDGSFFAEDVGR